MSKISIPILNEEDSEKVIEKIKEFGQIANSIKKFYPSVWSAMVIQYRLDYSNGIISDDLFDKKLEVLLLQDEELRKK